MKTSPAGGCAGPLVAGVVGEVAAAIFGQTQAQTTTYAHTLGQALQLTNIIRDVGDDARRGRIYLPVSELQQFDVKAHEILKRSYSERFTALMAFQARRAHGLYDEALALMARRGVDVPANVLSRDVTQPYRADAGVEAAWLVVYRDPDRHWDLYQLGEELVDLEDAFRQWRFRHLTTVERIIGYKRGTGGTGGVSYLAKLLELQFFPELWSIRTAM